MFDLHTHTIFSDGVLVPSELIRRYADAGYSGVVITDHVDSSNIEYVLGSLVRFYNENNGSLYGIDFSVGCEITHTEPKKISGIIKRARNLGARLVIVHGETISEPVASGTNRAAIESGADILAHPGLISDSDAELAANKGVFFEITSRKSHSYTNGHVAAVAGKYNVSMVYSSDFHAPGDLLNKAYAEKVLAGASLNSRNVENILKNTMELFLKVK